MTAVSVRLGNDHPVPASVVSDGTQIARLPGLTEGAVGIKARAKPRGRTHGHRALRMERATPGRPEPRLVSRAPLRTGLRWAALALAVGFALAGTVLPPPRRAARVHCHAGSPRVSAGRHAIPEKVLARSQ